MSYIKKIIFCVFLFHDAIIQAQIPEGKWYLEKFEDARENTDSINPFGMELLFRNEIGTAYYIFETDSVTHYFSIRGLNKMAVVWDGSNQFAVINRPEGENEYTFIERLSEDRLILSFSKNSQLFYLWRKPD